MQKSLSHSLVMLLDDLSKQYAVKLEYYPQVVYVRFKVTNFVTLLLELYTTQDREEWWSVDYYFKDEISGECVRVGKRIKPTHEDIISFVEKSSVYLNSIGEF